MDLKPVFISGPSGVGKSYLVKYLIQQPNFQKIVTLTTRSPRSEDIPGVTYEFVTHSEIERLASLGLLVLVDEVFDQKYGLRKGAVERILISQKIPICEVYSPHIDLFATAFPNAISVFLKPSSLQLLEQRMRYRGDSEDSIKRRLAAVEYEIDEFARFSHTYFSAVLEVSADNFQDVVFSITNLSAGG